MQSLDNFIAGEAISQIDLLKIDVEGHELDVLSGAHHSLTGKIRCIQFEFGMANLNSRVFFADLFEIFQRNSFALHRIDFTGDLIPITEYEPSLKSFSGVANYLASRQPL